MNSRIIIAQLALALGVGSAAVIADNIEAPGSYDLSWNTVDSGGDLSTGGAYQVVGTIGQPDAGDVAMTGGTYTLFGGFWRGIVQSCQADVTADNIVNIDDLLGVINAWGNTGGAADVNGDHIVNIDDLLIIIGGWGNCPP